MKAATAALVSYLDANDDVIIADLYTFSIIGGAVLRLLDYPLSALTIPAANFPGSPLNYAASGTRTFTRGPKIGRSKVGTKIGLEPSTLDINIYGSFTDLIGSLTWQQFEIVGGLDGATVELDRFFMPVGSDGIIGPLDTSLGAIVWFYGRVATVEVSRTGLKVSVKSLINLLQQQQLPRRIFQSNCSHIYGDVMCGYDRVNGKNAAGGSTGVGATTITAQNGSTQNSINLSAVVASYYVLGTCTCLTGANANISRGILSLPGAVLNLTREFPYPVAAGDTFQLLPGCDHTVATCQNTMQNLARFGGFPYIPPPELAI